jgi:phage baseplate assembly protein W
MQVHFPFMLDGRGRVADASHEDHIRQLIEQVLFTAPGERVNRPDFGCGLLRELFGPGNEEERIATRFLVEQALTNWLGELIETRRVDLMHRGEQLIVEVEYVDLQTRRDHAVTYEVSAL